MQPTAREAPQNAANLSKLTPDVVKKLTEKLSEMMGEDISGEFEQVRNNQGEFLNEDGLPIIDITEPIETSTIMDTDRVIFVEETPLPHLPSLPLSMRERLRQQRDSILDRLEEEERLQQRSVELSDIQNGQEILRKRKEAAAKEKEKLKATKEMTKKMGKVLLQNLAKEKAEEEEARTADAISDRLKNNSQGEKTKKSVSFADTSDDKRANTQNAQENVDWGDITPARLRSRPNLLPSSNNLPMKMTVVERTPTAPSTITNEPDSDDESDPPLDETPDLKEEVYDWDFARHQREVTLHYHEKRNKIGAAALAAMSAHSHEGDGDVRVDLPSEVSPSEPPERPSLSRFRATRLASSYAATSPSVSMGASVIPVSTARTLQKAVRIGKLDSDERLIGGDADSESEDETQGLQEVRELLKKGEVYNIGPDGEYLHAVPPSVGRALTTTTPSTINRLSFDSLPPIDRPKTSKFKASRPPGRLPGSSRNDMSISDIERSSPKLSSPSPIVEKPPLAMNLTVLERVPLKPPTVTSPAVIENLALKTTSSSTFPSMIVVSPSFPAPTDTNVPPADMSSFAASPSLVTPKGPPQIRSRPLRPPAVVSSAVRETFKAPLEDYYRV